MRNTDYQKKLTEYFKRNLKKGYTLESLRWALVKQGYSRAVIEGAIDEANKELAAEAPILKEKPIIKYEALDEENNVQPQKKSWWKRIFG
jgi:hypothetical protein